MANMLAAGQVFCNLLIIFACSLCVIVFLPEELRQALMPTLEKLYKQEPESLPFRQPVDPKLLGCLVSLFLKFIFVCVILCFFVSDLLLKVKE